MKALKIEWNGENPFGPQSTPDYLCFTAEEEGAKLSFIGLRTSDKTFDFPDLKYSADKVNWTALTYTDGEEDEDGNIPFSSQILTLGLGEKVYFKGVNPNGFFLYNEEYISILASAFNISEGAIAASGDIGTITDEIGGADCVLTVRCYTGMFIECTSLTTAPALPATTLADSCYCQMFTECTALTVAPSLPATTLANYCYAEMFYDCNSLTEAPALPATALAEYCYKSMFTKCTALTAAPALPAITLVDGCYYSMFYGCTFAMSDDGTTFNFQFGATLPQALSEGTLSTHKDVADWMDNITGFAN